MTCLSVAHPTPPLCRSEWRPGEFTDFYEDEVTGELTALIKFSDEEMRESPVVPIDLGLVIVLSKWHKRRRLEEGEGGAHISSEDLVKGFQQKERDRALASGKDYAKRPSSYKASLSAKVGAAKSAKVRPMEASSTTAMAATGTQDSKDTNSSSYNKLVNLYSSHISKEDDELPSEAPEVMRLGEQ